MHLVTLTLLAACGGGGALSAPTAPAEVPPPTIAEADPAAPTPPAPATDAAPGRPDDAPPAKREGRLGGASPTGALGLRGEGIGGGGAAGFGGGLGRAAESRSTRPHVDLPQAPMRAGKTDDNADYQAFLRFLGTWTDRQELNGLYQPVDVHGRTWVTVRDADGRALPDATVTFHAAGGDRITRTYGDGRAMVLPYLAGDPGQAEVEVRWRGVTARRAWTGADLEITLDAHPPREAAVPVDVAIVLDTTGSMSDEIARIKATLLDVTARLGQLDRPVDLRVGAVLYRDVGDDYVTRAVPFSADVRAFDRTLADVEAGGGGDTPEALNEALRAGVNELGWRQDAARVAFLIADAPPHMDRQATPYGTTSLAAAAAGIRVHSVAASGLDPVGSLVFRQIAQLTRGQFIFIEYGSTAASARSHGIASAEQIASNNLDAILFEQIQAEISGWRR